MVTPKGQENVSLLHRPQEGVPQPQTFTFESQRKLRMAPQPPLPLVPGNNSSSQRPQAQGANGNPSTVPSPQPLNTSDGHDGPRVERERTALEIRADENREYRRAARIRKEAQKAKNRTSPPKKEDRWFCYYCEYTDIFGEPPRALIRRYEAKEARARKDAAEKKRLLDKAKAKGRKLKKGVRVARAVGQGGSHPSQSQYYDDQYDPTHPQDPDSQADEFFEDGVDEDLPPTPYPDHGGSSNQYAFPIAPERPELIPPNGPAG